MRGYPQFNFPAFDSVAEYMRAYGWTVFNPADHDREVDPEMVSQPAFAAGEIENLEGFSFHDAMKWDLARVIESDAVVFLPGWEKSTGAGHEKYVAEVCGVEVLFAYPTGEFLLSNAWFVSDQYIDGMQPA